VIARDDFERANLRWTPYADGPGIRTASDLGITPETGKKVLAAVSDGAAKNGGVWMSVASKPGVPVRIEARTFTNETCGKPSNSRCRVGIDPTGAQDPAAASVVWSRWIDTAGAWDTIGVGQGDPIAAKGQRITAFLEYAQTGGSCGQVSVFDDVRIIARKEDLSLPKVQPILTPG